MLDFFYLPDSHKPWDLFPFVLGDPESLATLKANRPHPRNYLHTATNYRHTDKHLRLVRRTDGWMDGQTDGRMDGRTDTGTDATKYIISLASRSIKIFLIVPA